MQPVGARKVCLEDLNKDMFPEVQNENVVKYDVYLDILLMVSICNNILNFSITSRK